MPNMKSLSLNLSKVKANVKAGIRKTNGQTGQNKYAPDFYPGA